MKFKYLQDNHNYLVSHHDSRRYMFLKHKSDLCLGCADSDLKIPKEIQNKIIQTARKGDFSYCYQDLKLFKLINNFFYQKYNLTFNSENFLIGSGVINLIQI